MNTDVPRTMRLWSVTLALSVSLWGCHSPLFRGQSPDAEPLAQPEQGAPLVRELARMAGTNAIRVEGVGLVTGLASTGSDPPPSAERDALLNEMRSHDVYQPQTMLASDTTAMVRVYGILPPGVQAGDRFDVIVEAAPRTGTTSLEGGWLMQARLRPVAYVGNGFRKGAIEALATGDVLVEAVFEESETKDGKIRGRVLGGGQSRISRKLGIVLKEDSASVRASQMIANAINARYYHTDRGSRRGVAKPISATYIELAVPPLYQQNVERFVQVVYNLAVGETAADRSLRYQRLETQLLEPTTSASAALQLEGLGPDGVPILRKGLQSSDAEVRFRAAEALAYLDQGAAAPVLASAAAEERAFRWHALAALTKIDDVQALEALTGLLDDPSAETRYGAFRALQVRNPKAPDYMGEVLGKSFYYHRISTAGEPMVHFSRSRRQEVILFGLDQPILSPPFLLAGRRIMVKRHNDQQLKVVRFTPGAEDQVLTCPNHLDAMIRAIVQLGGRYEDVYQAVRSAKIGDYLPSRLVVDARPRSGRVYHRDRSGTDQADDPRESFAGPLPELFRERLEERGQDSPADALPEELADESPSEERGWFGKMKGWFSSDASTE